MCLSVCLFSYQRQSHTHTERDRDRDPERERDRETERERERKMGEKREAGRELCVSLLVCAYCTTSTKCVYSEKGHGGRKKSVHEELNIKKTKN